MPCNCSGVRMTTCSCKLFPRGFLGSQDMVLVPGDEKCGFGYRFLEGLYDKCAGYNLRYCPLRGTMRHDKCLRSAMKELMVIACFLVANLVVFLNILIKMSIHIYYVLKNTTSWIRSRPVMKHLEENNEQFYFEPHHNQSLISARYKLA